MFKAFHYGHFVHDPLGVIEDILSGILEAHFHNLLHGKLLTSDDVVHPPDNTTRPAAQLRTNVVLPGDHLGQIVGEIRLHVVEYKQLVLCIDDADHVIGPEDALLAEANQVVVHKSAVPGMVLYINRMERMIQAAGDPEMDFGNPP